MNNQTIVRRYVTSNYEIDFMDTVVIRDKSNSATFGVHNLITETSDIFNLDTTEVCQDWFKKRLNDTLGDVYRVLNMYRIRLGARNWEFLDSEGNPMNVKHIITQFDGKYSEKFIRTICNDWQINKIQEKSEELIRINA